MAAGFELTYCILQFAIHLREPAIQKNLKINKIAIQKTCRKKIRIKIIANVKKCNKEIVVEIGYFLEVCFL